MTHRQAHLIGVLRRADSHWLPLWELSQAAGYSIKVTAANVRELRRLGVIVTRPAWHGLSQTEVSLADGIRVAETDTEQDTILAIEREADDFTEPTRGRILDGFACVVCGEEHGPMGPAGRGPRGQVFTHDSCLLGWDE